MRSIGLKKAKTTTLKTKSILVEPAMKTAIKNATKDIIKFIIAFILIPSTDPSFVLTI